MIRFVAKIVSIGADGWRTSRTVCFEKPKSLEAALANLLTKCEEKCGGYLSVRLDSPHRPRTTGWKSQNHHLRGHARQLCEDTGFTMQEMMQVIKEDSPSWPVEYKDFRGKTRMIYASEADVSMEVCAEAIEITHRIAADRGINLIEGDE